MPTSTASATPSASSIDASDKRLEKLNLTGDEVGRIEKALKDEEFRKLLADYVKEISDPKNRALYEEEIAKMEQERGNDIRWVKPEPGFVVKTSVTEDVKSVSGGPTAAIKSGAKVFVNICSSVEIQQATAKAGQGEVRGQHWSLPYSLNPPREDPGTACTVFDCVFHPTTLQMAEGNIKFRDMLISTALEGVEKNFKVKLSASVRLPKLKFKGQPVATVIRSRVDGNTTQQSTTDGSAAASSPSDEPDFKSSLPFIEKLAASKTSQQRKRLVEEITKDSPITTASSQALAVPTFINPHYQVIHRGTVDMADFTGDRHRPDATRPRELLIRIDLPGVSSISSIELDTDVRALSLSVPSASPPFKLDITLPHDVEPTLGTAKFNKEAARLTVVLPVRRIVVERVGPEEQVPLERAEDAVVAEPKVALIQELPEKEQAVDTAPIEKKMAVPEMVSKENVPEMVANEAIPEETVPDAPAKPDHTMPSSTIAESAPIAKELQAPATAIAQPLAPTLPSLSTLSNSLLFDLDD